MAGVVRVLRLRPGSSAMEQLEGLRPGPWHAIRPPRVPVSTTRRAFESLLAWGMVWLAVGANTVGADLCFSGEFFQLHTHTAKSKSAGSCAGHSRRFRQVFKQNTNHRGALAENWQKGR